MNKYIGVIIILALVFAYGSAVASAINIPKTQTETGPAADELHYQAVPLEQVPSALGDTIDVYLFGLKPAYAENLPADAKFLTPASGIVDIIANPAPVLTKTYPGETLTKEQVAEREGVPVGAIVYINHTSEGTYVEFGAYPGVGINPFAFRKVRFALNYLIDRSYIVNSIYRGYAAPMYAFLSVYDPDYTTIADIIQKYQFIFNPTKAQSLISEALTAAGATFENGKWIYDGKPITIKFVIRIEDERKEIGDQLANALTQIGFTVERMYMTFGQAIFQVYFSNPADLEWHLYTEGWGKSGIDRWDYGTINQFNCPWYGWMPGLQNEGWWNYHNETLDELGKKIYFAEFSNLQERNWLYRNATLLALQEAVRVWIATRLEIQPYMSYVTGITEDIGAGLRSPFNFREITTPSGVVRIGHLHVWTSSSIWNPWGGFEDVYSVDIMRATTDPASWVHPFNGEPIPFRVSWTVETAGPNGTMNVPSDALIYDAGANQWKTVGAGVTAKSKVTLDFNKLLGAKWHDNSTITWADIVLAIAEDYELAYDPVKSNLEGDIAAPLRAWLDTVKGFVFHWDEGKVDVYVDYWHFDPNYIGQYAVWGVSVPAELSITCFRLAFSPTVNATLGHLYALSQARSEDEGIPPLDLVVPEVASDVKTVASMLVANGTLPDEYKGIFNVNGKILMDDDEFVERLNNLISWIDTHGHAWVSQGPFYIDSFDKDAQTAVLKAFRDPSYPFHPGDWFFGTPVYTKILSINTRPLIVGKDFEMTISVTGAGTITVKWLLVDPGTGDVILTGDAQQSGAVFVLSMSAEETSKLTTYYNYKLIVIAYSDQVALPDVKEATITTYPPLGEYIEQLQNQINNLQQSMNERLSEIQANLTAALGERVATALEGLQNTLLAAVQNMTQSFTSTVLTLRDDIKDVSDKVDALQSRIDSVGDKADTAASKTEELAGTLSTVQTLVIVNLILLLVAIAIPFIKK